MDHIDTARAKKSRQTLKIAAATLLGIFVISTIAQYVWLSSGSAEWNFKEERNGIRIWTQKVPNNPLLKGRAQFRVRSTLGGITRVVFDPEVHRVNHMDNAVALEEVRSARYYSVFNTLTQVMPWPFKTREFVLSSQYLQDPKTKAIEFNAMAAPNKIPASDCCVRLVHVHNRWSATPRGNGEVDFEFYWDIDWGGGMPYVLQNALLPGALYKAMSDFRNLMEKYKSDTFAGIEEPDAVEVAATP
jgi:hypothetical protein